MAKHRGHGGTAPPAVPPANNNVGGGTPHVTSQTRLTQGKESQKNFTSEPKETPRCFEKGDSSSFEHDAPSAVHHSWGKWTHFDDGTKYEPGMPFEPVPYEGSSFSEDSSAAEEETPLWSDSFDRWAAERRRKSAPPKPPQPEPEEEALGAVESELGEVEAGMRRMRAELEEMQLRAEAAEQQVSELQQDEQQLVVENERLEHLVQLQRKRAETAEAAAVRVEQLEHQLEQQRAQDAVQSSLAEEQSSLDRDALTGRAEAAEAQVAELTSMVDDAVAARKLAERGYAAAMAEVEKRKRSAELREKEELLRARKQESAELSVELAKKKEGQAPTSSATWDPGKGGDWTRVRGPGEGVHAAQGTHGRGGKQKKKR